MKRGINLPAMLALTVPLLFCGCGSGGGGSAGAAGPGGASAPATGTISGTATDSVNAGALQGVEVTVADRTSGGTVLAAGTTDASGWYSLAVPAGVCYVSFSKADYTPSADMFVIVVVGVTVTRNAEISVAPAGGWNVLDPGDLDRLKATKTCPGCRLYGAGLRSEDLSWANLSGAIMPDNRICDENSIGVCK